MTSQITKLRVAHEKRRQCEGREKKGSGSSRHDSLAVYNGELAHSLAFYNQGSYRFRVAKFRKFPGLFPDSRLSNKRSIESSTKAGTKLCQGWNAIVHSSLYNADIRKF